MARKSLKDKLEKHNADEAEAIKATKAKFSGLRAADILRANTEDLLAAGIGDVREHPDMKAALASRAAPAKPEAGKGGKSTDAG